MRNECQDLLMSARILLTRHDYDRSLAQCQCVLEGQPLCKSCPYGDECWLSTLSLISDITHAQACAPRLAVSGPMA